MSCSPDIKNTWSLINSGVSLNKKNNSVPELFCDRNKNFSSAKEIAEGFNEFFVNVGPNLANLIPESDKTFNQ